VGLAARRTPSSTLPTLTTKLARVPTAASRQFQLVFAAAIASEVKPVTDLPPSTLHKLAMAKQRFSQKKLAAELNGDTEQADFWDKQYRQATIGLKDSGGKS
jgi:hypothetical protein